MTERTGLVLVINAGSSSLKFRVFEPATAASGAAVLASGQIDGIGVRPRFVAEDGSGEELARVTDMAVLDHDGAIRLLIEWLGERFGGRGIAAVGHGSVADSDGVYVAGNGIFTDCYRLVA